MGASFKFDEMLQTIGPEANGDDKAQRQVEVFTHGGDLFLRVGPVNQRDAGKDRYTVKLCARSAEQLDRKSVV